LQHYTGREHATRIHPTVTALVPESGCALCQQPATESLDPPRQTFSRGPDPSDPSYSITVMLPNIDLCAEHALQVRDGEQLIGWCDDPLCRAYGEIGEISACGSQYQKLAAANRSRTALPRSRAAAQKTKPGDSSATGTSTQLVEHTSKDS
jgi:hypothetical protein